MKKLLIYSALALTGLTLPACGDEENKEDDPQPAAVAVDPAVNVAGQWNTIRATRTEYNANWQPVNSVKDEKINYGAHLVNLSGQGGYEEKFNGQTATGTYSRNNAAINLNIPQPLVIKTGNYYLDSLTTNRMVIRDTTESNGIKYIIIYKLVR